jgi:hypothetical protein
VRTVGEKGWWHMKKMKRAFELAKSEENVELD